MFDQTLQEYLATRVLLADGAMGTYLYARGAEPGRCLEELNVTRPDVVAAVHREYLAAGARLLETNTYSANGVKLERYGLAARVAELNERAAALAREAVGEAEAFVGGSVGPLGAALKPFGYLSEEEARAFFRAQMAGLLEGDVDLAVVETMSSLAEAELALAVWRELTDRPALVSLTFLPDGTTKFGDDVAVAFQTLVRAGADVVGLNCNLGPKETYDLLTERIAAEPPPPNSWFVSAMPNAGYPADDRGRPVYGATPEYFGEYARLFAQAGVRVVGGCCGTTPRHVAAMAEALAEEAAPPPRLAVAAAGPPAERAVVVEAPVERRGLADKLGREFVVTVEVDPPRGPDYGRALEAAARLRDLGVDAVNVADNPLARVRMSSVALAHIIQAEVGLEPILHFTCRDRNLLGLQSELVGAAALGIRTLLALTGDPSEVGDYPKAKSVFDLDSTGLVGLVAKLRSGTDLSGKPIGEPFEMTVGVALNPGAADPARESERLGEKVEAGADFAMTQPFYDPAVWLKFLERYGEPPIPAIVGLLPFRTFRHAQFLHYEVPGIDVPPEALQRMEEAAARGKEAEAAEGVALAREILARVREACAGVYVVPPFGNVDVVAEVLA
ncbi:MAG: bifunctional homocysteine S-methyltransferase/methylenetetrahydrofolate reductase [Candidatus Coatesbacteria bacterium]|nr:MAG: bifunctional homocysteine S-methyltransferase/methylenetetrahydrofolate reductase [Candidatus Coatesbacteria bacterium]